MRDLDPPLAHIICHFLVSPNPPPQTAARSSWLFFHNSRSSPMEEWTANRLDTDLWLRCCLRATSTFLLLLLLLLILKTRKLLYCGNDFGGSCGSVTCGSSGVNPLVISWSAGHTQWLNRLSRRPPMPAWPAVLRLYLSIYLSHVRTDVCRTWSYIAMCSVARSRSPRRF